MLSCDEDLGRVAALAYTGSRVSQHMDAFPLVPLAGIPELRSEGNT